MYRNERSVDTLVFDFDGTLIDSYAAVLDIYNELAHGIGLAQLSHAEAHALKKFTAKELFRHLHIPVYLLPVIVYQARQNMRKRMTSLVPFPDIPDVLQQLYQQHYTLGIVSTNAKENIQLWLQQHQLLQYFSFIHCSKNVFGKKAALKRALSLHQANLSQVFYIGDETRDIEAAALAGVKSIAVTWGFNAAETLQQYYPHHMINKPHELLYIV